MAKILFQTPKGVKDVLPDEQPFWHHIERTVRRIADLNGYKRINLPVFEETALFQRGVGEGTDIVEKEMYTFRDKGGASLTLRPELTAGIVRSFLQHGMASMPTPVKVWTWGPVFRYEKPQAGRFRQHTQFDVEAIGEQDPALDFEIMSVAWNLYDTLGFSNLGFQINSIGCPACRPNYLDKLTSYYTSKSDHLCDDCRKRLRKNPLRLLDCKNPNCQPHIEAAPPISESLCSECAEHFQVLRVYLDGLGRPYKLNHRLVRGLDYYTKTVFEVWAKGIGAQNAVCGGGRYDGLIEAVGGPPTPGVGFATGIERIVLTLQNQECIVPEAQRPSLYFVTQGMDAKQQAVTLLSQLRASGISGIMGFGDRSFKAQFREADKRGVRFAVILGGDEMSGKMVQVKDFEKGGQDQVTWTDLESYLSERIT